MGARAYSNRNYSVLEYIIIHINTIFYWMNTKHLYAFIYCCFAWCARVTRIWESFSIYICPFSSSIYYCLISVCLLSEFWWLFQFLYVYHSMFYDWEADPKKIEIFFDCCANWSAVCATIFTLEWNPMNPSMIR